MNTSKRVIIVICLLSLLPQLALALGVSPAINTIAFSPSEVYQGSITLYHHGATPHQVSLFAQGELAPYMKIPSSLILNPDSSTRLQYTLSLPPVLSPGDHTTEIIITQQPQNEQGTTLVSATLGVMTQIKVVVPYPGKYVLMDMVITEHKEGVDFRNSVINKGTKDINSAYTTFRITDATTMYDTMTTAAMPIHIGQQADMKATWQTDAPPGTYRVEATLHYDGKEQQQQKEFALHQQKILSIEDIRVKDFVLGAPAQFEINVKNNGNTEEKNIQLVMVVRDGTGKDTATMMSEQFMITPFSQKTVKLYWETETLIEGTYSAHLTLKSTSQTQGQDLILSVAKDKLDISRSVSPLTGQFSRAAEYPSKKSTIIMVSGGIGIFLIVIAVIILVMRRNSKKPL